MGPAAWMGCRSGPTNQGPSIRKRVAVGGRYFRFFPISDFFGALGRSSTEGARPKAPTPSVPVAELGSRLSVASRRRKRLRLWRGSPRTRSPLPFLHRL
jgi:hypothetical protein